MHILIWGRIVSVEPLRVFNTVAMSALSRFAIATESNGLATADPKVKKNKETETIWEKSIVNRGGL